MGKQPPPPVTFDTEPAFSLRDIIAIMRYRWLPGVAFGILAALAMGWFMMNRTPIYYAEATVFLEPKADRVVEGMQEVVDATILNLVVEMNDHMDRLRSRQIAEIVAQELTDPEKRLLVEGSFNTATGALDLANPVSALRSAFNVQAKPNSLVLILSGTHPNPEAAALVANAYAEVYIRYLARERTGSTDVAITFLRNEIANALRELERGEQQLQDYRARNNLISIEENKSLISSELNTLSSKVNSLRIRLITIDSQLNQIKNTDPDPTQVSKIPVLSEDRAVSEAVASITNLTKQREILSRRYLERHPVMIENEDRINAGESLLVDAIARRTQVLREEKIGIENEIKILQEQMIRAEEQARDLDQLLVSYDVIARKVDSQRRTYERLVTNLDETEVTSRIDRSQLKLYDEAVRPNSPISPSLDKAITAAAAIFCVCMVGVPFALETLDNKVRTFLDIDRVLKKPLLTDLKFFGKSRKASLPKGVIDGDEDLVEPFRNMYSNIHLQGDLPKPYALIVSSTLPEEGKSFVAANTAAIFSRHDYKTLLVDCDLRRPTIARQFGLDNDAGILHWLRSGEAAQMHGNEILDNPDLGIRKLAPSFDVLTTGGSTKSPTEILSSGLFDRLVSAIKTRYEIIIFDTPPIGLFPDATILADFADSSIYVVRQRRVKRTAARHGINLLDRTNARPIGIVLNAVSTNPGSGIDYGGGTYSAYGHYGHYGYGAKTKYQKHYGEKNDEEDKAPSISA